jgi:integrase
MIMSDLFDLFQKTYGHEVTTRVRRDYRRMFNTLDDYFGHMEISAVKPKHVAAFINEPGYGKVHRNRHVMILNMVFLRAMGNWCIDFDLTNPCIPVRRHPTKARTRYVTDAEFAEMRAMCPPSVQIAMDLALLIGQRQGDIIALRWDHVFMEGPRESWEIWIDQGKTGKRLAIGISPAVEAVLMRAKLLEPQLPRMYVVHTKFGRRYTGDGFRALWQVYMRMWRANHPGEAWFTFHDLRAKCVSDNKSLAAASLLAGHRNQTITGSVYDRNRRRVEPLR